MFGFLFRRRDPPPLTHKINVYSDHLDVQIDHESDLFIGNSILIDGEGDYHSIWYKKSRNRHLEYTTLPIHVYDNGEFIGIYYREGTSLYITDISNSRRKGWRRIFNEDLERGLSIRQRWMFPIVKA